MANRHPHRRLCPLTLAENTAGTGLVLFSLEVTTAGLWQFARDSTGTAPGGTWPAETWLQPPAPCRRPSRGRRSSRAGGELPYENRVMICLASQSMSSRDIV